MDGPVPEYTVAAACSVVVVLLLERWWLRTGILRTAQYWISMAIVGFFQVLVDGVLTDLDAPLVTYDADAITGLRWPGDIPVEDYLFGFSLITATMLVWVVLGRRRADAPARSSS
jgi:lycopene cyclase domain-containing protein